MARIIVLHDPAGAFKRDEHTIADGSSVFDWIIDHYGPDGFGVPTVIYRNHINDSGTINLSDYTGKPLLATDGDVFYIIHQPLGPAVIFAASLVLSLILVSMIDIPKTPELRQPTESPNNNLTGQTNIARPLQRIPDIYGKNKVYPDLIAKSYFEYINHVKYLTEYLCIGRGEYLVEELKSGETLISDIDSATADVYEPYTIPPELLNVTEASSVNGQELFAPNELELDITSAQVQFSASMIPGGFVSTDPKIAAFDALTDGDPFTITGVSDASNDGTYTFKEMTVVSGAGFPATYRVYVHELTFVLLPMQGFAFFASLNKPSVLGPFVAPGSPSAVWVDINAPQGLQDNDNRYAATINVRLQQIDGDGLAIGSPEDNFFEVSGNTRSVRNYTFKVVPAVLSSRYEVELVRVSDTNTGAGVFDQLKWARLAAVEEISVVDFGDVTTVKVLSVATEQATRAQSREFNAVVTRKLNTYNTTTGEISITKEPTARMADAVMHILTDKHMGNRSFLQVDLAGLYEIQERLDTYPIYSDTLGRFCYSFSNKDTSVIDEVRTALNAARCSMYRSGNVIKFIRDEADDRVTLFNRRNKKPGSEKRRVKFYKPNDYNGVSLQYVDEATNDPSVITFPEDATIIKQIEAAGIKNYFQAWNRAKYEYLRILHHRVDVDTVVTREGEIVAPNSRVGNVDGTDIRTQDGEVVGFSGFNVSTSEPVDFNSNPSATVIFRNSDGSLSDPVTVTPIVDDPKGFVVVSYPFEFYLRGDDGVQVGVLYSFAPDSNHLANDYIIQDVSPTADGYVNLKMINYAPEVYGPDSETPPPI